MAQPLLTTASIMSRPRRVLPGGVYLLTRRCTQRQFLLRPDEETNNAFIYCLAEAAQRFGIVVLLPYAASNHYHAIVYDPNGCYPAFLEHFHKMIARCLNARWGHWENLWAAGEPGVTELLDRDTIIAKLVYTASNPVQDLLVQHAHQWPGTNGYRHFLSGKPMHARRPRFFFSEDGTMPEEVTLTLEIPPELELGSIDEVRAEVRAGVEAVERQMLEQRAKTGARVIGVRAVLAQSWRGSPSTVEPRRKLRPRYAGREDVRVPALRVYKAFLAAYAFARKAWLLGKEVTFPPGTYWLSHCAPIALQSS